MKHNYIVKLSALGVVCSLVLRVLQLLILTDADTGFGKVGAPYSGLNIAVYLMTALMAAGIFVMTSFFSKRQPVAAPDTTISPGLSVFSFIMAVYMLCLTAVHMLIGEGISNPYATLRLILLLLSAIFFIFYGLSGFGTIKCPKALTVAPLILAGYDLVAAFISYTGMANISDNVYECIFLCLGLLFFLLHGKIISSVDIRRSARLLFPVTYLAVFFGFLQSIPPILVAVLGGANMLHSSIFTSVTTIFPTVYILLFTSSMYKK